MIHLGGLGAGQLAKLVNNAMLAANLAVADDALALAHSLGLHPAALVEVIQSGSARSYAFEVACCRARIGDDREQAAGPLGKDLGCLNGAAPNECAADAALLTHAARQASSGSLTRRAGCGDSRLPDNVDGARRT